VAAGSALALRGPLRLFARIVAVGVSGKAGEGGVKDAVLFRTRSSSRLPLAALRRRPKERTFIVANNVGRLRRRPLSRHRRELRPRAVGTPPIAKSRDYEEAASFLKIEREEIAGAVPTNHRHLRPRRVRRHRVPALRRRPRCRRDGRSSDNPGPRNRPYKTGPLVALRCAACDLQPMFAAAVEA